MHGVPHTGRFTVITGHYGCGKTNLAINLALDLVPLHGSVTLVDLDVVNPYFRSSDHTAMLAERGVRMVAPTFAGTTLDVPALSPAISGVFDAAGAVIFDVGGDDAGATALGRFAEDFSRVEYGLLYVVNAYRALTSTPGEAAEILREIEAVSHLHATGVVNNSHLRGETTAETVLDSLDYATRTAELLALPLAFTTVPKRLAAEFAPGGAHAGAVENAYPVETYVRTPWESRPGDEEVV